MADQFKNHPRFVIKAVFPKRPTIADVGECSYAVLLPNRLELLNGVAGFHTPKARHPLHKQACSWLVSTVLSLFAVLKLFKEPVEATRFGSTDAPIGDVFN